MNAIGAAKKTIYQIIAGMARRYLGPRHLLRKNEATDTVTPNQPPAFALDLFKMSIKRSSAGVITCVCIVATCSSP